MKFSTAFWLRFSLPVLKHLRTGLRYFSYAGTAFWLRFSGILVTLRAVKLHVLSAVHATPVFPCNRPCIKTPVVGQAKLWKYPVQVITGGAAAQRERACEHLGGEGATSPAETGSRRSRWRLAVLGALVSPTFVMTIVGYIHSRPNTGGVAKTSPFDGERAFADLKRLVGFGPRPSGSPALERAREFITDELRDAGATVIEDRFTAATPIGQIPMVNLVATIPGSSPSVTILAGHYDTKRMSIPFVGANDGASSAAFLLEMARVLGRRRNRLTYWLVFFDGEEGVQRWSSTDSLYGSRHFASMLGAANVSRIEAMFVLDMIADAHLDIQRESHSTPWLNELLFTQAYRLGYTRYFLDNSRRVEDDHLPFGAYCEVMFNPAGARPAPAINQFGWVAMAYVCGAIQMRKQRRSTCPQWLGLQPRSISSLWERAILQPVT
jgi:glutaminyl-peptide cyclotransferase